MSAVVEARGLGRWYGQVVGVNDLDATVGPGITASLSGLYGQWDGENGADNQGFTGVAGVSFGF